MKMKKFIAVVSMVGMLAAAMTGCGSGSDDAKDADKGGDAKYAGDWDSANDITVVSREDGSGTRGAFIELFGIQEEVDGEKVDMTTTEAQITNNTSVMMTTVEGNEYAIGYISLGSLDEDAVKALKIDGAEATAENIENGSYKVSRPFNVAVKKDLDNEAAKDFMSFIQANQLLDSLYRISRKCDNLNTQEQLVFLMEAEKVFEAFDKIPTLVWEDEYRKYSQVLNTYKDIRVARWGSETK